MKTIYYISFLDPIDRDFVTRVIHKLDYLASQGYNIQLIAFFNLSQFKKSKQKLKETCGHPFKCLTAIPGLKNWSKNKWLLQLLIPKGSTVIGKDVFACNLLLQLNKNLTVIYDACNSFAALEEDYQYFKKNDLSKQIHLLEKTAVRKSHLRWSSSEALIRYWQKHYDYQSQEHVVYPCDCLPYFKKGNLEEYRLEQRLKAGFQPHQIIVVYLSDFIPWNAQHFSKHISDLLGQKEITLLFLGPKNNTIDLLQSQFPEQIIIKNESDESMAKWALLGDYSYHIYPKGAHNWVSAPLSYSESLQIGLTPLINFNVSQIKNNYHTHSIGVQWSKDIQLTPTLDGDRKQMRFFAQHFLQFTPGMFKTEI